MAAFPLVISFLIALTTFFFLIAIYRPLSLRKDKGSVNQEHSSTSSWERRVSPYLSFVPVPDALRVSWEGASLERVLIHAGIPWDPRSYIAFRWAAVWLAASVAMLWGYLNRWNLLSQFLFLLAILGAYFGPQIWLDLRRQRRCEMIDLALPNYLDRLTLSMEAGLGFEIALRRTSENFPGLLGEELRRLVRAVDRGHTRSQALDQLVGRTPSSDLLAFVTAVKQSDRLGTSLARTLRVQSQILRTRRKRRAEEAGRRLPILIVFPLVFFFLPALLIIYLAPPLLHLFLGR